jgi:hypothetical protein
VISNQPFTSAEAERQADNTPRPVVFHTFQERDLYVKALLAVTSLGAVDKLVLTRLAYYVNLKTGRCNPATETLARDIGTHERSVRRKLAQLEAAGWLNADRTRGRVSNQYALTIPASVDFNPGILAQVNPGYLAQVQPGQKCPPTRVKVSANPGNLAPLTAVITAKEGKKDSRASARESESLPPAPAFAGGLDGQRLKEKLHEQAEEEMRRGGQI